MNIIKRMALTIATVATVLSPIAAKADGQIQLQSALLVANVTNGATPNYQASTSAKVDEVVRAQVAFMNNEAADSGKNASNVMVKVNIPTAAGATQTVTSAVSADNATAVNGSATVNLSLASASLQYIPGSAAVRYNAGTNANPNFVTKAIGDSVVTNGYNFGTLQPCSNFEATVTVEMRVIASAVTITKQVRVKGQTQWSTSNTANPGDTLQYLITVKNAGNTTLNDVVVGDNMPGYVKYVNGTTQLKSTLYPNGITINDNITTGGVNVGNYVPGSTFYIMYEAKIDANMAPGTYSLKNTAIVQPKGMNQYFNVATTTVTVPGTPNTSNTPSNPSLPQTGAEGAVAGVAGTGALGYALTYYRRSRKAVVDALKGIATR
jgi:uncharacterized repeat protein (TIGR01451 family)